MIFLIFEKKNSRNFLLGRKRERKPFRHDFFFFFKNNHRTYINTTLYIFLLGLEERPTTTERDSDVNSKAKQYSYYYFLSLYFSVGSAYISLEFFPFFFPFFFILNVIEFGARPSADRLSTTSLGRPFCMYSQRFLSFGATIIITSMDFFSLSEGPFFS